MTNYKETGEMLRKKRKALNLSQDEVADFVGVSTNYISLIERGSGRIPSGEVLTRMSTIYRVDELELFEAFDKLPTGLMEIVKNSDILKNTLYDIQRNSDLTEAEKAELFKGIQRLYLDLIKKRP
ncbi:helix-turn-helix domain-containing protein [Alkalicoccobacillus gibsonii]|uniref:helix-turn-helix domain-containing protein n=1 Tax=Alkalicoccobacillus gibsonii TaxID=79881 RepID=UPI00351238E4